MISLDPVAMKRGNEKCFCDFVIILELMEAYITTRPRGTENRW
jgi:hypothetical protein